MNANRYRLIFDKRTGMLVPVAEFTSAAKKGNSPGMGDGMGDTTAPRWGALCAAIAIAAGGMGTPWSLHAQMVTDGSTQTTVTQTSNGTPLINIANPNASGLSHNKFTEFNVDNRGAVFNNSRVDANTQIGGHALKNPHLTQHATGILTEVTGTDITRLQGSMEVHGAPADLIVANPNGLDVNARLGNKTPFRDELEIAVPNQIDPRMIVGAYRMDAKGQLEGAFIPNPGFESPAVRKAESDERNARRTVFSQRYAQLDKALEAAKKAKKKDKPLIAQLERELVEVQVQLSHLMKDMDAAARRDGNRREFID